MMVLRKNKHLNLTLCTSSLIKRYKANDLAKRTAQYERSKHIKRLSQQRCRAKQRGLVTSDIKTWRVSAIQVNEIQVLPSLSAKHPQYNRMTNEEKRVYCKAQQNKAANGNNKGQKVKGCYYLGKDVKSNKDILLITSNANIKVTNTLVNNKGVVSNIVVRYLDKDHSTVSTFVQSAGKIAKRWEGHKDNSCQRKTIRGMMTGFGVWKGAGDRDQFAYGPTSSDLKGSGKKWRGVNKEHRDLNVAAREIAMDNFKEAHKSIQSAMRKNDKLVPDFLGGERGECTQMVQSQHNLVTEAHLDMDHSKCFSIWTVKQGPKADTDGWYFVLPYLKGTYGGKAYKGIAIELRHCVGIEWDGRNIFHCSTAPLNNKVNVYGTFFGITVT